jgi:stage II sporulation protein D
MWFYHRVLRSFPMRILVSVSLAIAVIFCWTGIRSEAASPDETIRIAILKSGTSVTIEGDGILVSRENDTAVALGTPVVIRPGKDSITVDGVGYRRLIFSAPSAVFVNGKPYRGVIEVSPSERGLLVVNELLLEDYLVGLINCEISSAWPIEAVKAQAVIARTYALNRKEARKKAFYHLESSVIDQVYDGCLIEDSRARRAVSETSGEVLTYNGAIIQAFYHSNCGGKTEAAENVWGASLPYMKGVDCQYCLTSTSSAWEQKLALKDIEEKLKSAGFKVSGVSDIRGGARNERGRLRNVVVVSARGEVAVGGDQFRKAVGYGVIKSTNFTVKCVNGEAIFSGLGNGHGVGLCQWGSKQRALDGFGYAEILSYYYPGTELRKR